VSVAPRNCAAAAIPDRAGDDVIAVAQRRDRTADVVARRRTDQRIDCRDRPGRASAARQGPDLADGGDRRVVGVVLGGRTARSRDAKMAGLLDKYLGRSAGGNLVATTNSRQTVEVASAAADADLPIPGTAPRTNDLAPKALGFLSDTTVPLERPFAAAEPANAGKIAAKSAGAPSASGDWQIQISAASSDDAARALLAQAKAEGGAALKAASPYTEAVGNGANKVYRARFIGFQSREAATSACDALKQRSYDCMLLPDHG